jgi:predicted phosphodiesterase
VPVVGPVVRKGIQMTVTILHLSDIHIDKESDGILFRPTEVSAAAFWAAHDAELVVILVSGDIAYSGTEEQYKLAEKFLTKIRDSLRSEVSCPIEVVTVPGNHDCDFEEDNSTREVLIGSLSGPAPPQVDESVIESCTRVQNAYFGFRDRIEEPGRADGDRLLWRRSFDVRGHKIWFECLNVSWVSKKKETLGSLYFPISRYSDAEANGSEVRIVTMHHPANWFSQTVYRPFRKFVHSRADILITGHEHEGNVGIKIQTP